MAEAVGGALASTLFRRRQRSVASEAPSTAQTRGPLPPLSRGRMHAPPFPRAHVPASGVEQQCQERRSSYPVARIERSEIRVRSRSFNIHPGFHFVQPELRNSLQLASGNKKKGSGTPADAVFHARTQRRAGRATETAACAALPLRARSPAGVPPTALAAATERHRSAPVHALPGTELRRNGCYPFPAVPVQRAL